MNTHEAGRESAILSDIIQGRKTVEGRLAKGKFLNFKPGDLVELREDVYLSDMIIESRPKQATSVVTKIDTYESFRSLLEAVGFENVLPRALDIDDAISQYRKFYSVEDEATYGVLAIHFRLHT